MDDKNDLLIDLIKHLRDQSRQQRVAFVLSIAALCAVFAGALVAQNIFWLRLLTELVGG